MVNIFDHFHAPRHKSKGSNKKKKEEERRKGEKEGKGEEKKSTKLWILPSGNGRPCSALSS